MISLFFKSSRPGLLNRAVLGLVCIGLILVSACVPRHPVVTRQPDVPVDPALVHGRLANGFQYVLKKNPTPGERVYMHLDVFAGSVHETDAQQGVAHYLEHMLFNGSRHFKPGELVEYFQSIGMDFGADANARTGFYSTVYDLALPDSNRAQLDKALLIMTDYASGALLLESEVDRERGVILAEMRERDSVSYRTFKQSLAFELPGSRLNRRWPIGLESVIRATDRNLLKSYYDRWYRPDNMALVVVGDMDVDLVERLIRQRFSRLRARSASPVSYSGVEWTPHSGDRAFYHHEAEAAATDVSIQVITYRDFKPQTVAMLENQVLQRMAAAMVQDRINRLITRGKSAFSEGSAYVGSYLRHIEAAGISATCEPGKWEQTLSQLEHILRQALVHGFGERELDRVRIQTLSALEQAVSLSDSRKSQVVAGRLIRSIENRDLLLSAQQRLEILKPFVASLTPEKVHSAFVSAWDRGHRLISVTGNLNLKTQTPESRILSSYHAASGQPVSAFRVEKAAAFPYLDKPQKPGTVSGRSDIGKDLGIEIVQFANRVRLNLKQTDFKPNEFSMRISFGRGLAAVPPSRPGLGSALETVINESGFGQIDSDQLSEALAGRKVRFSFQTGENAFILSGSGHPSDAETLFQVARHFFLDPGFRPEILALYKTRYRQEYEALSRTPDGMMQIRGSRFLAQDHPGFGLPSPDQVDALTLESLRGWISPALDAAPLEISVVGDFNPETITALAARHLGSLAPRDPFVRDAPDSGTVGFPSGRNLEIRVKTKIDSALVSVAFKTDDFWDIMQTRQLSVLARVFSERLRKTIREELGQSYSPYVYNRPSLIYNGYGVMHVRVNVKPGSQQVVLDTVRQIAASLEKGDISTLETRNALKPVLTHLKTLRQTNGYWLNSVMAGSSRFPEKLDWARNIMTGYGKVDNRDLIGLAAKYLSFKDRAVVVVLPEN